MSFKRVFSDVSSFSQWKYDIFLSFRGEDTRRNFTDHLYDALNRKGFSVFRDDKELERGKSISPGLFEAIEASSCSIIVFSRNYAYSTWCLDELVKIVECKNTSSDQQMVFPIFYDVEPTAVRKQRGNYQEAFAKHEEVFRENIEKVQKWKEALKEVANISGWELEDRHEVEFIQEIVKDISRKLRPTTLRSTLDDLVGMNSRLEKLRLLLGSKCNDVRMIGICGMGGIGKTTMARFVYDLISCDFEGSSFLANVREISEKDGLIPLQKQLLSEILLERHIEIYNDLDGIQMIKSRLRHKKVLVIIDDVVHISQLNKLASKHSWFGLGSRIIITTRDKHLLTAHRVDQIYNAEALNYDEALELFCLKAFNNDQPPSNYVHLTNHVVRYASGLPLALKVLGSFLFGRTQDEWKSAIQRLNRDSEDEILNALQISFEGLKEAEKKIFLDIACFFKGDDRDNVTSILDACGVDPVIGINVLIEKSLIKILDSNALWMHDLLQQMGQQIVKRQSPDEPGRCSRLWEKASIHHVLQKNTGTEVVEAIKLGYTEVHFSVSAKAFQNMTNLRLLHVDNMKLPEGLHYLSEKLCLLEWHEFPLKYFPSSLLPDKIVVLNLCFSSIKELWKGIKTLYYLKFMKLSHSKNLVKIPDVTGAPNLEKLIVEGCTRLHEIHSSLFVHKKLIILNLQDCTSLTTLPSKINMESLRTLIFSGCSKLKRFPKIVGTMECLSELLLDGTAVKELPVSIEHMTGVVLLNLNNCINLVRLPNNIDDLKSLKFLKVSGCFKLQNMPENLQKVQSLEELDVSGTAIKELPDSIKHLTQLVLLNLNGCINLTRLPSTINGLKSLQTLNVSSCFKLENVPENLGELKSLEELDLSGTAIKELPESVKHLTRLILLNLNGCNNLTRLPSTMNGLKSLKTLNVSGCFKLENMPENLGEVESLEELDLSGTAVRQPMASIFLMKNLKALSFHGCKGPPLLAPRQFPISSMRRNSDPMALTLPFLSGLYSLTRLDLSDCNLGEGAISKDICNLFSLVKLNLSKNKFVSLPGTIDSLSKLEYLKLEGCQRLKSLPKLPSRIQSVRLNGCASLEIVSDAFILSKSEISFISCLNCPKLLSYNGSAFSILRSLKLMVNQRTSFTVPESQIPEWFKYQNKGSSISITRPSELYNKNKVVLGFAICCVFHVHKHSPPIRRSSLFQTHMLAVCLDVDKTKCGPLYSISFDEPFGRAVSDHLWLLYLSQQELDFRRSSFESDHVELSYVPLCGLGFEVKSCGVHPFYASQLVEFD